jgi:hypothetical protein
VTNARAALTAAEAKRTNDVKPLQDQVAKAEGVARTAPPAAKAAADAELAKARAAWSKAEAKSRGELRPVYYAMAKAEAVVKALADKELLLSTTRPGVLLPDGDFLEASFKSLQPDLLTVESPLIGIRELRPATAVDSVVFRKAKSARRGKFKVETWDGQIFSIRGFTVSGGNFIFNASLLGKPAFAPGMIRRIFAAGL